jgi:AraC family transcriptional regulator
MDPVRKALWFIEGHSRDVLTLDDIAQACRVSPFHLTRAFASMTGISLMRYVRARRLTEAARQLQLGATDILSIALEAGYGSHEAFTRAFRDQFGLTPEQVRALGHSTNIPFVEAITMNPVATTELSPPRFESLKPMRMAGLVERYDCQAKQGIPNQWQRFVPYLGTIRGRVGQATYGLVYNFDSNDHFDYMSGVEVTPNTQLPSGFQDLELKEQNYAVFTHKGHIAGIHASLAAIWGQWFPESGHQTTSAPVIERYGPEFDGLTGLGGFEIWIPIKEKGA